MRNAMVALLLCLLCYHQSKAQELEVYNSDSFWSKLTVHHELSKSIAQKMMTADTVIALVSNRIIDTSKIKFAAEKSNKDQALRFAIAFVYDKKWHLVFYNQLSEILRFLPDNKSLVVYTEGYGKVFTTGLYRAFAMQSQYKDVNVLYLDYPSLDTHKNRLGNWNFVNREAQKAGLCFLPVLDSLRLYQSQNNKFRSVNLFYHSMGNLALMSMMRQHLSTDFKDSIWIDNLILNAPCVPVKKANKWMSNIALAKQTIVHYNPEDKVLKGAPLISRNTKMGRYPFSTHTNHSMLFVNFNTLVKEQHSYFLDLPNRFALSPTIKNYFQFVLNGHNISAQDTLQLRLHNTAPNFYTILP